MSIDDAIKEVIERETSETRALLEAINQKLDIILSVIVAQQKDACAALGISSGRP